MSAEYTIHEVEQVFVQTKAHGEANWISIYAKDSNGRGYEITLFAQSEMGIQLILGGQQ